MTGSVKSNIAIIEATTNGASGITQEGKVVKDPSTGTCRIYFRCQSDSNIGTGVVLGNIPDGFRPKENVSVYGIFKTSSTSNPFYSFHGNVATTGAITQSAGSTIRDVFLVGEYFI